jgi:hypothetical protein
MKMKEKSEFFCRPAALKSFFQTGLRQPYTNAFGAVQIAQRRAVCPQN